MEENKSHSLKRAACSSALVAVEKFVVAVRKLKEGKGKREKEKRKGKGKGSGHYRRHNTQRNE